MYSPEIDAIMEERFGHDSLIALATSHDNIPAVRVVNAYYREGSFYVITHAHSQKMRHIADNPTVSLCGDWFSAQAEAENLGWLGLPANQAISAELFTAFASWIHNGHNDLENENTVILQLRITHGILFSHGTRYELLG